MEELVGLDGIGGDVLVPVVVAEVGDLRVTPLGVVRVLLGVELAEEVPLGGADDVVAEFGGENFEEGVGFIGAGSCRVVLRALFGGVD